MNVVLVHKENDNTWDSVAYDASVYATGYYQDQPLATTMRAEDLDTSRVFIKMLLKEEFNKLKITKEVIYYA